MRIFSNFLAQRVSAPLKNSFLLGLSLTLAACSSGGPSPEQATKLEAQLPPVELAILDARKGGGVLEVDFTVQARTPIRADDVAIQLDGIGGGKIIRSKVAPASNFNSPDILSEGETVRGSLKLSAGGLDEYELRVAWGANAQNLLSLEENLTRTVEAPKVSSIPAGGEAAFGALGPLPSSSTNFSAPGSPGFSSARGQSWQGLLSAKYLKQETRR